MSLVRRIRRFWPILLPGALAVVAVMVVVARQAAEVEPIADATPALTDTWAFEPPRDSFDAAALLDLRYLNEQVAGQSGFVRVDGDGGFLRGDGQPIRFWAINTDLARRQPNPERPLWGPGGEDLTQQARFLAKRGVNMVRLHRQISPDLQVRPDAALTDINEAERDAIWRTVAAMRQEGIYTTLSPYWAMPMKFAQRWGLRGGADQPALGLLFFDEPLQAAYREWLRRLLTEKNPYTGLSLAEDPSLAILQLQNEDSLLFWTVEDIRGAQREQLERLYLQFLLRKYGSSEALRQAWDGDTDAGDRPQAGRLALLHVWELTQPPTGGGRGQRLADQTEFYARTMHEFNRRTVDYLRHDLGVRTLINAGNWKTASAERLGDVERWTYGPGEVDAVNHYVSGLHQGPDEGWAIVTGDRYSDDSVLRQPYRLPVNLRQTRGRPIMVTEGAWVLPGSYGAEGPFLVAAYTSLTGVAAFHWFALDQDGWATPRSANGYMPSLQKWTMGTPETLGSFPAAALAFRRGDIRRAEPVRVESRTLSSLWRRDAPALPESPGFDPNRDRPERRARGPARDALVPPETFLVGPVQVTFNAEADSVVTQDLSRFLEPHRVRSATGELVLDHQLGVATIDTPRTQGVAAHFDQAPEHQLSVLGLRADNAFGALMAVSLDGEPLAQSRRVLLQYATRSRPTGWQDRPVTLDLEDGVRLPGREVVSYGQAPWRVEQAQLQVSLRNAGLRQATALDMNGMAVGEVPLQRDAQGVRLRFPPGSMYVVLR
ncbi:MAG: hypothetical protein R3E94_17000 [Burkholderiaceae bacterium]